MSDDFRMLPHDIEAEMSALGSAMLTPNAANVVFTQLSTEHFYRVKHRLIFRAIVDLYRCGEPVDAVSVCAQLETAKALEQAGGMPYIHDLVSFVPTAANVGFYVNRIRELGTKRIAIEELTRIAEYGYSDAATADEMLTATADALMTFRAMATDDDAIEGFSTLGAFVNESDEDHDWLIPGVLERMDRVIVVASEGAGKTTFARQVAVQLAAGVHPFSWHSRIPPVRTLYVDLENPPALVRRKIRHLVNQGREYSGWDDDRAWRWTRPGGIDLRKPHDQHLVDRVIAESGAEFVAMGPLYKAFTEAGEKAEIVNGQVARVLDGYRERHGITLWLETHAPMEQQGHRSLRPMGSGVWSRWPEFGLAMRKSKSNPNRVHLERFRGDRDERSWPHHLERSSPWPWSPVWDGGFPIEEATSA
ncbi:DnaB-like helicase N-terminal domain-containing protein [Planobispora rosea]|uniref:DnaB-like helicase N-terminal domain-containing protein n=1 Tax=Planobispora rosea TaxID=35762 RepID=UPI00083AAF30|nr:DnaB-like helicase N-terminal domain-containing protein [Planobispora rosea]